MGIERVSTVVSAVFAFGVFDPYEGTAEVETNTLLLRDEASEAFAGLRGRELAGVVAVEVIGLFDSAAGWKGTWWPACV